MSLFSRIFGNKSNTEKSVKVEPNNSPLSQFYSRLKGLLNTDKFLARTNYRSICDDFSELYRQFHTLKNLGTLGFYCEQNIIDIKKAEEFISIFEDLNEKDGSKFIAKHIVMHKRLLI